MTNLTHFNPNTYYSGNANLPPFRVCRVCAQPVTIDPRIMGSGSFDGWSCHCEYKLCRNCGIFCIEYGCEECERERRNGK